MLTLRADRLQTTPQTLLLSLAQWLSSPGSDGGDPASITAQQKPVEKTQGGTPRLHV